MKRVVPRLKRWLLNRIDGRVLNIIVPLNWAEDREFKLLVGQIRYRSVASGSQSIQNLCKYSFVALALCYKGGHSKLVTCFGVIQRV